MFLFVPFLPSFLLPICFFSKMTNGRKWGRVKGRHDPKWSTWKKEQVKTEPSHRKQRLNLLLGTSAGLVISVRTRLKKYSKAVFLFNELQDVTKTLYTSSQIQNTCFICQNSNSFKKWECQKDVTKTTTLITIPWPLVVPTTEVKRAKEFSPSTKSEHFMIITNESKLLRSQQPWGM